MLRGKPLDSPAERGGRMLISDGEAALGISGRDKALKRGFAGSKVKGLTCFGKGNGLGTGFDFRLSGVGLTDFERASGFGSG